jgi:uroporphyrinogen decarboxylase
MNINMTQWKQSVLQSRKRLAVPLMTHPGIALTGHSVLEAVTNPEVHAKAVQAVAKRYPTAAATMIMDLSVEAEAFGAKIRFDRNEVPSIVSRTVESEESIERLAVPSLNSGRPAHWVTASGIATRTITDRPVFAECIGPFSLAARLYDVTEIMTAILTEPETILKLVNRCTQFLISYCAGFKSAGANGVLIAEPVAGVLSEALCTEFSSTFIQRIVRAVQDDQFLVILHNCGETEQLIGSMAGTGAAGLHFGNRGDIMKALNELPADTLVFGNIDPVGILKQGSPASVDRETSALLTKSRDFRNLVLSSGCDVPPNTPMENIDAFFSALDKFNQERK